MKVVRSFSPLLLVILICLTNFQCSRLADSNDNLLKKVGVSRGICVILGDNRCELAIQFARKSELLVYLQLPNSEDVAYARKSGLMNRLWFNHFGITLEEYNELLKIN